MKSRFTTLVATLALTLTLCAAAQASPLLYVTGTRSDPSGSISTFGTVNTATGEYREISTYSSLSVSNLTFNGTNFYVTTHPFTPYPYEQLSTLDTSGNLTIGPDYNRSDFPYSTWITGTTMMNSVFYGYDVNSGFGTINTSNALITTVGGTGPLSSIHGMMTSLNGTIYALDTLGKVVSVDPKTGNQTLIDTTDGAKGSLEIIYSDGTGLYTLGTADHQLYSFDTGTGAYTDLGIQVADHTGPTPYTFTGAAVVVPEPSTYALLCVSLGVVGYARKRMGKSGEAATC